MSRLILINGLPCVGKSTVARCFANEFPLTLVLDVDVVRGMLGRWSDNPSDAGLAARRIAIEMARSHLSVGCDVVIPQFLGSINFVLQLEQLCNATKSSFIEVVLRSISMEDAARRFAIRSAAPESQEHLDALVGMPERGSVREFAAMQERLDRVLIDRPETKAVASAYGDIEETVAAFMTAVKS